MPIEVHMKVHLKWRILAIDAQVKMCYACIVQNSQWDQNRWTGLQRIAQ